MSFGKSLPGRVLSAKEKLSDPETIELVREDVALVRDIVLGKAKERFAPLVGKLAGKAYFENNPEVSHVVAEDRADHAEAVVAKVEAKRAPVVIEEAIAAEE
jgi:hypothetical protein